MPILNNRDYRLAKAKLFRLKRALGSAMSVEHLAANLSEEASAARKNALQAECDSIQKEIERYEKLRSSESLASNDLEVTKLGFLPIIARIQKRLSQKQFADILGVKEQQIQRYESERYASIGLKRFEEILDILGVELKAHIDSSQLEPKETTPSAPDILVFSKQTLREIKKRGWIPPEMSDETSITNYLESGRRLIPHSPHYRQSSVHQSTTDFSAVIAWQAHVANQAKTYQTALRIKFDFSEMNWLRDLIRLSRYDDGPLKAKEFLATKGIVLVVETHLQNTYLDGAAFLLPDRTPVVGLTLRYDRIDYFWFTLLHELGHIFLHYGKGLENGFLDDFDDKGQSDLEKEADSFARSSLIPDKAWQASAARFSTVIDPILSFAENCEIHPAIVVGRIQRERSDFKLFRNWLGQGKVRTQFL